MTIIGRRTIIIGLLAILTAPAFTQDTLRVLHYNLLYYGNSAFCTESNNNTADKGVYLDTIKTYYNPHVLTVNELGATNQLADQILTDALNTSGVSSWKRAALSNVVGSNIVNMLYYDSDLVELEGQETVSLDLTGNQITRDVIFYHMYYVDPNWPTVTDTVRFTVINAHLHSSDEVQRDKEASAIMNRISQLGDGNYILSGDLNVDASNEASFQEFIAYNQSALRLYDPVNQLGTWHTNPSYADLHTQSTHSSGSGCPAGGGLDDRFDFTLVSDEIMNATEDVAYIQGTYKALGQDGTAYNQDLPVSTNQVVPLDVAEALYNMSDHLPVASEYLIGPTVSSVEEKLKSSFLIIAPNPINEELAFRVLDANERLAITITDLSGRVVDSFRVKVNGELLVERAFNHPTGVYLLNVTGERGGSQTLKLINP